MTHYEDNTVQLDDSGIRIKNYRKRGHTKSISYSTIDDVELFEMGFWSGRHRLIGLSAGRPRNWFPWERNRSAKRVAISLDVGTWIRPTVTPDDPEAVATILTRQVGD